MLVKLRFRFSEAFFGMLLAVAIFAIGLVIGSSRHQPAEKVAQSQGDKANQSEPVGSGIWNWLTHDSTGVFTSALVIVGLIQIGVFLRQLTLIRKSLKPAQDAAEAAKLSAQAVIDAERAHLYVIIKQHNVGDLIDSISGHKYSASIAKEKIAPPILSYVFKNYGKTPATIELVMQCMTIQKTEGGRRLYETLERAIEILGEREESNPPIAIAFEERRFLAEDAKSLGDHDTMLFFYSGATFRDAFNRRHKIRHDFLYSAGRFHLIDREEKSLEESEEE